VSRIDNYKFGPKNNWRRTIWNEISSRVGKDKRDGIVLYLAGLEDLDRAVAVEKGFHPNNLIAIDRDQRVVDAMRAQGKLAIKGDLSSVIAHWPHDLPIAAIVADFCCGLEKSIFVDFVGSLTWAPLHPGCVVAVNLQRGRDPWWFSETGRQIYAINANGEKTKHRGKFLAFCVANTFAISFGAYAERDADLCTKRAREVLKMMGPRYFEYKSGNLSMDSFVLSWPRGFAYRPDDREPRPECYDDLRPRISAMRSIRTRRTSGALPVSPSA
jgi:hypothetical protein